MRLVRLHPKKLEDYVGDLRKGKRTAQHEVYELVSGKMLGVCRQYIRDMHYAEDVMIKEFMKVFTQIDSYKGSGSFEGWIRRIMIHEAISFLRTQKSISFIEEENIKETVKEEYTELSADDIHLLIGRLPEGCRTVFNLYVVEGYKHVEIAKMLQIQEGTSKSQLAQARKLLQKQLTILKNQGIWSGIK